MNIGIESRPIHRGILEELGECEVPSVVELGLLHQNTPRNPVKMAQGIFGKSAFQGLEQSQELLKRYWNPTLAQMIEELDKHSDPLLNRLQVSLFLEEDAQKREGVTHHVLA